ARPNAPVVPVVPVSPVRASAPAAPSPRAAATAQAAKPAPAIIRPRVAGTPSPRPPRKSGWWKALILIVGVAAVAVVLAVVLGPQIASQFQGTPANPGKGGEPVAQGKDDRDTIPPLPRDDSKDKDRRDSDLPKTDGGKKKGP